MYLAPSVHFENHQVRQNCRPVSPFRDQELYPFGLPGGGSSRASSFFLASFGCSLGLQTGDVNTAIFFFLPRCCSGWQDLWFCLLSAV